MARAILLAGTALTASYAKRQLLLCFASNFIYTLYITLMTSRNFLADRWASHCLTFWCLPSSADGELPTCDIPNPWEIRTTALRLHTDRYWSYKCQCCRETLGVRLDSSSSRIGPEGSSPQRFNSMQDMPTCHHGFALPTELLHNIISWVLVNSIHSICVSTEGDVIWEKNVMNYLCDVSPSFRAIAIEIVAKAFEISRGTDEEEERWTPTLYYLI